MTGWSIRVAGPEDADLLVALEDCAFGPASWGAQSVAQSVATPGVETLFAAKAVNAAPDGFAIWRQVGDEAEILSIGARPDARRKGCASALVEALSARARRIGVTRLFLEVDAGNVAAASLYARVGFVVVGRRARYYRNGADALVMRVDL